MFRISWREFTRKREEDGSLTEVKVRIREITNENGDVVKRISVEKIRNQQSSGEIEVETELEVKKE